jgi:hypothetical protein
MTKVIVDRLEAVDVAEEDSHPTPRPVGLQQRVVEMVEQEPPVGQPGQRVLEGVASQLLFEGLAFGSIAEDDDGTPRRRSTHDR